MDFENGLVAAMQEEIADMRRAKPTDQDLSDAKLNEGWYEDEPFKKKREIEPDHILIQELYDKNVKFSEKDIVFITRDRTGQIVWLETGNPGAGLMHILDGNGKTAGHATDFEQAFGVSRSQVPAFLKEVITNGEVISNTLKPVKGRLGFERIYAYKGKHYLLAGVGTNGFITSAYPV